MIRDPRYASVKALIESGHIKSIRDIFINIPKTTVYKDLGINFNRFDRAILNPSIFRMQELVALAELFEVDAKQLIDIAYEQYLEYEVSRRKNR
jgi:hypothetical protein